MSIIDKQLSRFAQRCDRVHANRWDLALANGRLRKVSAHHDDGFLLLDADTGLTPTAENLLPLAMRSRELPATLKLALHHASTGVKLRAEFPVPEDSEASAERIRESLEGMRSALHQLGHQLDNEMSCEAAPEEMAGPEPEGQAINGSLPQLLEEAGWPYHQRSGGELLADLETGDRFLQAGIANRGAGARFSLMLYRNESAGEVAQQALCLYLLEVNAELRYVRAFVSREGAEISAGFEVCVDSAPSAAEAGHALSALSVAGRRCAGEVAVLKDDAMAGIYRTARRPFYH